MEIAVNAGAVLQVDPGNPQIDHRKARAVLALFPKLKLAVREEVQDARDRLKAARVSAGPSSVPGSTPSVSSYYLGMRLKA